MTAAAPVPETPPMSLREFLAKAADHFRSWEEDFYDYAKDYFDEEEAQERQEELTNMLALSAAAEYWRHNYPMP